MKIRIEGTDDKYGTKVWIDDVEMNQVTRVQFDHQCGQPPYVRIDMWDTGPDGKPILNETKTGLLRKVFEAGERGE